MVAEELGSMAKEMLVALKPALEHLDTIGMGNVGIVGFITGSIALTVCALLNISNELSAARTLQETEILNIITGPSSDTLSANLYTKGNNIGLPFNQKDDLYVAAAPNPPDDPGRSTVLEEDDDNWPESTQEEQNSTKPQKVKVQVNLKSLFGLLNSFGFLGLFIPSKPLTPIISLILLIFKLLSSLSASLSVFKLLTDILVPVVRTVALFDSIRFVVFNGVTIANAIFIDGKFISFWLVVEIFGYLFLLLKLTDTSFFSKIKRRFSHYIIYLLVAMHYTYFSPEYLSPPLYRLITFCSFYFVILQIHFAITRGKKGWIGRIVNVFNPEEPEN